MLRTSDELSSADQHPQLASPVMAALLGEVYAEPHLEKAGVLVGRAYGAALPQINAVIPAVRCRRSGERATLTNDAWSRVQHEMGRHYGSQQIVGWYVARDHGVRLTARDTATQERYFGRPGQVALVFDAPRRRGSVYVNDAGSVRLLYQGAFPRATGSAADKEGALWRVVAPLGAFGASLGCILWLLGHAIGIN
jgi:hypothetical protein